MGRVHGRVQLRKRLLAPGRRAVHRLSPAAGTGGLLAPAGGARRLHWTNAVIGCNNFDSYIFQHEMLKLFYFISDLVPR